ncbi:DUF4339 domain-containing protein [Methylobacterium sp. E-065]|uniref:DUF4339 domain-containing protein n=1 Tax=Methylobacterium sp. E-065 TaxID=2836583 RepID=UPI001FBBC995|nr:DUF4339 domain-containing protein [Methylobacterium sp. E-065]MCJ2017115.1 DUF4339 domain-containing protein [Methylobacterium sp. E-065]
MPDWYYERAGTRAGPVDEAEMHRLLAAGTITRATLVWNAGLGPNFVPLGETTLAPPATEPPPLPASAVDDTLAWVLVAIPLGAALLERAMGWTSTSLWGWPLAVFLANVAVSVLDERRVIRSGVSDRTIRLGAWVWLVPVYLYQRARALKGPRYYVWAWLASFAASLFVGGEAGSLLDGETYLGTGVPACDSRFEIRQVRQLFDGLDAAKAAGIASSGVTSARELGAAGEVRTCAAQIGASNGQAYTVVYTVERSAEQIVTNIQVR